jgi:hypothetical protein
MSLATFRERSYAVARALDLHRLVRRAARWEAAHADPLLLAAVLQTPEYPAPAAPEAESRAATAPGNPSASDASASRSGPIRSGSDGKSRRRNTAAASADPAMAAAPPRSQCRTHRRQKQRSPRVEFSIS